MTVQAFEFVERFASFWRRPSPERLTELLVDDVTLVQPLSRATHGITAAQAWMAALLRRIPDLHAEVERAGACEDGVLIEFRLEGTVGGRSLSWSAVDRFVLRDGKAVHRVSYFDGLALALTIAARPRAWLKLL